MSNECPDFLSAKPLYKRKWFVLLVTSAFLITILFVYGYDYGKFCYGVKVAGVPVGGLDYQQAQTLVVSEITELLNRKVDFVVEDQEISISLEQLGLQVDIDEILTEAYAHGRKGSVFSRLGEKLEAHIRGINFEPFWRWNEEVMLSTLVQHLDDFNRPPRDASFTITENNVMEIQREENGRQVDYDRLMEALLNISIEDLRPLEVPFQTGGLPQVTYDQLQNQRIDGLLASYSTTFDPQQVNRTNNIRLAAEALDKTIIAPDEIFSFNETVGPRTYEAGYREAMVISGGQFVLGVGGGVCQVSSTLYNAFLLANLKIVERQNHSLAIDYVPLGQDATVAYPYIDLKCQNNSGGYLLLRTKVEGNTLTVEVYGRVVPEQEVIITNVFQSERTVLTYRTVKIAGEIQSTELISRSYYN